MIVDRHVLALVVAGFLEPLRTQPQIVELEAEAASMKPTTGIAVCCARAASGHAAAAPPRNVINSRRFTDSVSRASGGKDSAAALRDFNLAYVCCGSIAL
jgi:hypothetical protein